MEEVAGAEVKLARFARESIEFQSVQSFRLRVVWNMDCAHPLSHYSLLHSPGVTPREVKGTERNVFLQGLAWL